MRKEYYFTSKDFTYTATTVLANKSDILILNKPTTGQGRYYLTLLTNRLRPTKNSGKVVLSITHDLKLVSEDADRVLVLKNGKVYGIFGGNGHREKDTSSNYSKQHGGFKRSS